jgi:16S rRNA (uracil1498-N3)-methyltransferase
MITAIQNGFLILEHLSKIELYYTQSSLIKDKEIILRDDEFHHCVNVMRKSIGDNLFVTDGKGNLYESKISRIADAELISIIKKKTVFENKSNDIWFCIPSLKNPDRLKFAFEKCVELGITNFILFSSKNIVAKKLKPEKLLKTTLAAMKQSLRTFLPKIVSADFNNILQLQGTKIIFEQNSEKSFDGRLAFNKPIYFLFGPEGGFDEFEIQAVDSENIFSLSPNRLRSETAIIKCASILKY